MTEPKPWPLPCQTPEQLKTASTGTVTSALRGIGGILHAIGHLGRSRKAHRRGTEGTGVVRTDVTIVYSLPHMKWNSSLEPSSYDELIVSVRYFAEEVGKVVFSEYRHHWNAALTVRVDSGHWLVFRYAPELFAELPGARTIPNIKKALDGLGATDITEYEDPTPRGRAGYAVTAWLNQMSPESARAAAEALTELVGEQEEVPF